MSREAAELSIGNRRYRWTDLRLNDSADAGWAHPGAAVSEDGTLYAADASGSRIVAISPSGAVESISAPVIEIHGIASDARRGLWLADNGHKLMSDGVSHTAVTGAGQVVLVDRIGALIQRLEAPQPWNPCGVALHDFGRGSSGRVWVADGYGRSLVHCFSPVGELLWTSDGTDSGLRFKQPHGITVDPRDGTRILVADRGNRRIVALSLDGAFLTEFGGEALTSPSSLAIDEDRLWVTELHGSLAVFDRNDRLLDRVGRDLRRRGPHWPNASRRGGVVRPTIPPGAFRSPHGIAARPDGVILVTEWLAGGRVTQLTPEG